MRLLGWGPYLILVVSLTEEEIWTIKETLGIPPCYKRRPYEDTARRQEGCLFKAEERGLRRFWNLSISWSWMFSLQNWRKEISVKSSSLLCFVMVILANEYIRHCWNFSCHYQGWSYSFTSNNWRKCFPP